MDKSFIISDINNLKHLALDSSSAYALRVRIIRNTLKLLQIISNYFDLPSLDRLDQIPQELIDPKKELICKLYNSLSKSASSLSQPSEALDKKWDKKWNDFLINLTKIEEFLKS